MRVEAKYYEPDDSEEGHEYSVQLIDKGEVLDHWDSNLECYRGRGPHLTLEECKRAVGEIRRDVDKGGAHQWFNV